MKRCAPGDRFLARIALATAECRIRIGRESEASIATFRDAFGF